MKHWPYYLILLSLFLGVGIPLNNSNTADIQYSLTAPQITSDQRQGVLVLKTKYRHQSAIKIQVNMWGADHFQEEYLLKEDQLEIPFTVRKDSPAVIYQIRLTSDRGDYAFAGRVDAAQNFQEKGLKLITDKLSYRPGDTIRILAMNYSTDKGLKKDQTFHLTLLDSQQNILLKEEKVVPDGLLIHEMKLSPKVNEGEWTLLLKNHDKEVKTQFDVQYFTRRKMDISIHTNHGYISSEEKTTITVSAQHLAGGSLEGATVILKNSAEEKVLTSKNTLKSGKASFLLEPTSFKNYPVVDISVVIKTKNNTEEQSIRLPVKNQSASLVIRPEQKFTVKQHQNICLVYFDISPKLKSEFLKSLKFSYLGQRCSWQQQDEHELSLTIPNAGDKLHIDWRENGNRRSQTIDTSIWPEQGSRIRLIPLKPYAISGVVEWNNRLFKTSKILLTLKSGNKILQQKTHNINQGNLIKFNFPNKWQNQSHLNIDCQLNSRGGLERSHNLILNSATANSISLDFKNDVTKPGSIETLTAQLRTPEKGVAALVVNDRSLMKNSQSNISQLKDSLGFNPSVSPALLESTLSNNNSQIKMKSSYQYSIFTSKLQIFFTCVIISGILALFYSCQSSAPLMRILALTLIIFIGAAMLLPALGKARQKAKGYGASNTSMWAATHLAKASLQTKTQNRRSFKDNLLFKKIEFDQNGRLEQPIHIADNLTTWQAEILGFPKNSQVVYGKTSIVSTKDLFIEFDLPVFFVKGDQTSLNITIFDKLKQGGDFTLEKINGIRFGQYNSKLAAGRLRHELKIPIAFDKLGNFSLSAKIANEQNIDQITQPVEVRSEGVQQTFVQKLTLTNNNTRLLHPQPQADALSQKNWLLIYPGTLAASLSGIEKMIRQPSGCFEQTSSKNFPNTVIYSYLKARNLKPELHTGLKLKLQSAYQRLLSYEVFGGGFSLYGKAPASPWLTAYGLLQFSLMQDHIFIDPAVLKRSWTFLLKNLTQMPQQNKIFAMMCAQQAGFLSPSDISKINIDLANMAQRKDLWSAILACRLMNKAKAGDPHTMKLSEAAIQKVIDNNGSFQSVNTRHGKAAKTAVTALALILAYEVDSPQINQLKSKLNRLKNGARWEGTMATAFAIKALTLTESNGTREIQFKDSLGKAQTFLLEETQTAPLQVPLLTNKSYNLALMKGQFLNAAVITQAEFRYGANNPTKPNFNISVSAPSLISKANKLKLSISISADQKQSVSNPMLELPLAAGFTVNTEFMKKLVKNGSLRHFEITEDNKIICYLNDLEPRARKQFTIELNCSQKGAFKSMVGKFYEYYRPELTGFVKLSDIQVN
jgi:hypothetical protein